ncbi:alpha/beta fold hydrolase [Chitinimonas koreensis]|uniref:alpha/beta fold hydrolase n=1 Tax=Chitinimonas koreensis TaxID=356302 RepID=UPI000418AD0D|nr:alpha/beta hydrolase [Chitinimonas koreensis]
MSESDRYRPVHPAESTVVRLRGLDHRVLRWGRADGRPVLLLHGWMDCAASFQFMVDAAPAALRDCALIAPDWRGFGDSGWAADSYYFPDYLADLDALLDRLVPDGPVALVGHSMGGIVAGLYAGIRPERVGHYVSLEGFGLPAAQPAQAPERYRRWLDQLRAGASERSFADPAALIAKLRANDPRLPADKAAWLAGELAHVEAGGARLRGDPRHKWVNPVLYRLEEAMACWRRVSARTLWLAGDEARLLKWLGESAEQFALRRACFADLDYAVVACSGHNLHHDAPAEVARRVVDFLAD